MVMSVVSALQRQTREEEDAANLTLLVNRIKFLQHLEGHGNILMNILHSMPHVPEHLAATAAPQKSANFILPDKQKWGESELCERLKQCSCMLTAQIPCVALVN